MHGAEREVREGISGFSGAKQSPGWHAVLIWPFLVQLLLSVTAYYPPVTPPQFEKNST
jgi:hypothetical protein